MNINLSHNITDIANTQKLAYHIANLCSAPSCITLSGDLGSGKTTFCQFFIQALTNANNEVTSPTFTLVQTYDSTKGEIWHYDMYRLNHEDEIIELAFDDALDHAITLVEWPERIPSYLPKDRLDIQLTMQNNNRHATLIPHGHWHSVLTTTI